jgi:hypothetical protein
VKQGNGVEETTLFEGRGTMEREKTNDGDD